MDARLLIALCVISGIALIAWAWSTHTGKDDDEPPADMGWGV